MPDLKITIGSRDFEVFCQPGEEHFLRTAAALLDAEANLVLGQIGRMPDLRLLLMAGLMVADKAAAMEDQLRDLRARLTEAEMQVSRIQSLLDQAQVNPVTIEVPVEVPVEVRVEVPVEVSVIPDDVYSTLEKLAEDTEALADRVEDVAS
ncbi:MAG TPA: cell division protein ZapA [Paenirhodobacter sp.]